MIGKKDALLPHPKYTKPPRTALKRLISTLEHSAFQAKLAMIRQSLNRRYQKLRNITESILFKELDRIVAILDEEFIQHRSIEHLSKLAYFIALIKKKISQEVTLLPLKSQYDIRLIPASLTFTFGSKSVLGVLAHAYLKDKYEAFAEEHVLLVIKKSISEAQLVKGSVYAFQSSKDAIKTLYFEIDKQSGVSFTPEEIKQIKGLLKQEMKFCIEQLAPHIFMTRNEEEVLRSILTLSHEITQGSDLPQVMIFFDRQTSYEAIFTIVLVRVFQETSIAECLSRQQEEFTYLPERCQVVRYLTSALPIEANVFRMNLLKDPSLLRANLSLHFYLARQKISLILTEAIGEFRDFNGGIILKQREGLTSFMEAFPEFSLQNPDLLESFFYSISPIEAQATLSLEELKPLFELFSEALSARMTQPSDYFLKFHSHGKQLFFMIRLPNDSFKETVRTFLANLKLIQPHVVSSIVKLENTFFLGYFLQNIDQQKQRQLREQISNALKEWKSKMESRQILKLCLGSRIVSLDPRIGVDQVSAVVLKMLFEGLMRMNREGKLEPGIARQVEVSADQKTYLFHLRSTLWSNGSQVTAYDFEYAWKKILSPTFKTPLAYLFYPIKNAKLAKEGAVSTHAIGIETLDDLTLKIELEFPSPYFLELTTHPIYSPVHHLIDQRHPNWPFEDESRYVCNGAFQLKKKKSNEEYELVRNMTYWDRENIKLDKVIILRGNPHQSYEIFQKNLNHWVGAPVATWDPSFSPGEEDELVFFSNTNVYWFAFNTQVFPFHHKKIRQALSWGIDRSKLKKYITNPPIFSPIPPIHSQIKNASHYSIEQAQALFKEGLKELNLHLSDFPPIVLMYYMGSMRDDAARFIKEEWEAVFGIKCKLEPLEWKTLFTRITEGSFQVGGISWEFWTNDPLYTLNAFRGGNELINFAKWENKQYEEVVCLAEREGDLEKRYAYYLQAEQILLEEMPVLPLFLWDPPALKKKNFHIDCSSTFSTNFKWGYFS